MRELEKSDSAIKVVWRAFELRPEPVPTLDPAGAYLRRAWATSVYPQAERLGVTMKLPPLQPRSRRAHEAAHWARTQGRFDDYDAAIFRAFFERGEDIGAIEVLTSLASALKLPGDALRDALERRLFEASVLGDEGEAAALGVSGVPAFVAERRATLIGVQPVEHLLQLIEHVRSVPSTRVHDA